METLKIKVCVDQIEAVKAGRPEYGKTLRPVTGAELETLSTDEREWLLLYAVGRDAGWYAPVLGERGVQHHAPQSYSSGSVLYPHANARWVQGPKLASLAWEDVRSVLAESRRLSEESRAAFEAGSADRIAAAHAAADQLMSSGSVSTRPYLAASLDAWRKDPFVAEALRVHAAREAERTKQERLARDEADRAVAVAREAKQAEQKRLITALLAEYGTDSQRVRWREGVLPSGEVVDILWDLIDLAPPYEKLRRSDVPHTDDCPGGGGFSFEVESDDVPQPHAVWDRTHKIRDTLQARSWPEGVTLDVCARLHTVTCDACDDSTQRFGVLVTVTLGGFTASREFGVEG